MKVCLTNSYGSWTNAKTGKGKFAQRLIPELEKLGVRIITDPLINVDIDLQFGKFHYKHRNAKKTVLRLGAVHMDTNQKWQKLNKPKADSANHADGVIYQSQISKKLCHRFITKPRCLETVIFNGDDPARSEGIVPYKSKTKYNFLASTRVWLRQKRLKEIVKSFEEAEMDDCTLWVAGDTRGYTKNNSGNINYVGLCDDKTVLSLMMLCKKMIHVVWIDACPNSVVEALCSGCFIIHNNQGGTPELVGDRGIVAVRDKPYTMQAVDMEHPPRVDRVHFSEILRQTKEYVGYDSYDGPCHISTVAKQYVDFFERVLTHG